MAAPVGRWWLVLALVAAPLGASAGILRGTIVAQDSGETLAGAVIVLTAQDPDRIGSQTAVAEDDGTYVFDVEPGTYSATILFGAITIERRDLVVAADATTLVPPVAIDLAKAEDYDLTPCRALYDGQPPTWRRTDPDDVPVIWRRDHRGLDALLAGLDPAAGATTLDRGLRLPGAPAIALELLDEHTAYTAAAPIELAGASGGVDQLALIRGNNHRQTEARLALGRDSRFAATMAGPVVEDDAWWSSGVVLDQTDAGLGVQGLGSITGFIAGKHDLAASTIVTRGPDGSNDAWLQASTIAKTDDYRRQVELGVVAERLDTGLPLPPRAIDGGVAPRVVDGVAAPRVVDRLGARMIVRTRGRWRGTHAAILGGELGGGHADGVAHSDVRAFVGDSWSPRDTLVLDAAVRWDRRVIGARATELLAPRLAISWQPFEPGEAVVFATVERTGQLDEGSLGAWRDGVTFADTATTGYAGGSYRLRWTAALRARLPRGAADDRLDVGFEGDAQWQIPAKDWLAQATVSTLERAATLSAAWACGCGDDTLQLAAIARATPDDLGWGASAAVRNRSGDDQTLTVQLEALDTGVVRTGHLVMSAIW